MAKSNPHGMVAQLLALRRCQFIHPGAVLLHYQRARRLFFRRFPHCFHGFSISQTVRINKPKLHSCRRGLTNTPDLSRKQFIAVFGGIFLGN
jgi:hypothetical protein